MRVAVTGASGFVGRAVLRRLDGIHDVIATDRSLPSHVDGIVGDLADPAVRRRLLRQGCDAIVHLASIPGGAAERDREAAWSVNVEATRALADEAATARTASGMPTRFIFASSIAVFGDPSTVSGIDDDTTVAPRMVYGGHKALIETWLAVLSRRGELSALTLRLPGIVARPSQGAGLKSAFMSEVFYAVRDGRECTLPVGPEATMWLLSAKQAAENVARAIALPETSMPSSPAVTLPALRLTMADLVEAIGQHTQRSPQVAYAPDAGIERAFGRLPPLVTSKAEELGFTHDGNVSSLVANAYGDHN